MIDVIRSESRGHAEHGWLSARHTFSFADYHNPERVRFGSLRVVNEDRIAPGKGFGTHPHRDMEILTYPISGAIEHKDNMGNRTMISAGEVQRMTAGRGIQHSEFNHSNDAELHLLQIWILPEEKGLEPGYEQTGVSRADKLNQLRLIASRDGRAGSITIHQDADLFASVLEPGVCVTHATATNRKLFVQVVYGEIAIADDILVAGDGAQIIDIDRLDICAQQESELLLFDMG